MTVADRFTTYAGADWLAHHRGEELAPLAAQVADLLGWVEEGIYHLDFGAMARAYWGSDHVAITLGGPWSSFDNARLMKLVLGAYDLRLRVEIRPVAFRYLQLWFSKCDGRFVCGDIPTIEKQIERLRKAR